MSNIKQRLIKLESFINIEAKPLKLAPTLTPKQWGNAFGGLSIQAEPLTTEQHEWINQYRGVSNEH